MGSSSRSNTSSSNTTVDNTFNNVDNRVGDEGSVIGGNTNLNASNSQFGNVSIVQSDQGAINAGLTLALESLDSIDQNNAVNAQTTQDAVSRSLALAGETSKDEAARAVESFMKIGAIVILGGGALFVLLKKVTK